MVKKKDFEFDIVKHIGVISEGNKGWRREVNSVSWNGAEPKYDIRDWSPEHDKMGKGISLTENEAVALSNILKQAFSDKDNLDLIKDVFKTSE